MVLLVLDSRYSSPCVTFLLHLVLCRTSLTALFCLLVREFYGTRYPGGFLFLRLFVERFSLPWQLENTEELPILSHKQEKKKKILRKH